MPHPGSRAWTLVELDQLRTWRAEGLSNLEIARRLGRSDRSVALKSKDLGLVNSYRPVPPQPRRDGHEPIQRAGLVTLPPLPSLTDESTQAG